MTRFHRLALLLAFSLGASPAAGDDAAEAFFEVRIRPVLVERCYKCHSVEAKKQRGGLLVDTKEGLRKGGDSGAALVERDPAASLLMKAIRHQDPALAMPPEGKLPAEVIADFERWIAGGAVDPRDGKQQAAGSVNLAEGRKFWSFIPPKMPELPPVKNSAWVRTPVDRFILARLEQEGIVPVRAADRRALLRRASFDLLGLPPTPEEVEAFVADPSPDAFAAVVDRLLASPHYGERWARHWLDVARYAEDQAHTFGVKPNTGAWRYRDWVIDALNQDLPYDQFIMLQIAADLMDLPEDERLRHLPALGFFGLGAQYYKNSDAAKAAADELDDRVDTLSRGFLGLTVSCARCHDHKYDPIPQADYYSLAGVFASCKLANLNLGSKEEAARYARGQELQKAVEDRTKKFLQAERAAIAETRFDAVAERIVAAWRHLQGAQVKAEAAARQMTKSEAQQWAKFFEKSSKVVTVQACRNMFLQTQPDALERVQAAARELQEQLQEALKIKAASGKLEPPHSDVLRVFLNDPSPLLPSDVELTALLPASKRDQLDGLARELKKVKSEYPQQSPPTAHGLAEASPKDLQVLLRGSPQRPGETAPRRFLRVLAGDEPPLFAARASGRLELARAIAAPENPLTARVLVNRLWQRHFGRGLVATPSNFGTLGDRPTHPELLDYLAVRLVQQKGSLKALHREILLSAVYQLSADTSAEGLARDADNRWLWRRERARLDIEGWRDAILAVSGNLSPARGGPTFDLASNDPRRTVYAKISRNNLNQTLRLFDFPDANITSEKRTATTVPQQQLFALNSPLVVESAKAFAARLQREEKSDDARLRRAYALAFGRAPSPEELALIGRYLSAADPSDAGAVQLSRWERLAQSLLISNEFQTVE